jgi:DNA-binding transcriptional ArsR family regulator
MLSLKAIERALAAMGEVSRLRLLLLCLGAERAVGELAAALNQSEPRVSRHLKVLADASLVERRREGHRVLYRTVASGDAAELIRAALSRIDPADTAVRRDAARAARSAARGHDVVATESRLGRALRDLVPVVGSPGPRGRVLLLGLQHLELIDAACRLGSHCQIVAGSPAAVAAARSWVERQDLQCDIVTRAAGSAARVEVLVLDRVPAATPLPEALAEARERLAPGGALWLFERYDALESVAERVVEHPLARLRRVLGEHGFACERIQPLEADGLHVLATKATRVQARVGAA